ncbi:MAG: hypothetical protein DI630_00145 [Gordonia sp. (in: high G+C Gram-positive bacteria)]|nr:MAG: hypothetical protein DI630_00145 [Gordonia sp. (in: high G+C Gram-positive bacteria)]
MTETFYPDDALPIHYLDGDNRGLCSYAGHARTELGGCPRGCSGATEHYSNDGHRGCAHAPDKLRRGAT